MYGGGFEFSYTKQVVEIRLVYSKYHIFELIYHIVFFQAKSRDVLLAYVVFLKEQNELGSLSVSMEELSTLLVLSTNHGLKKPAEHHIFFTPSYGNNINLQKEFPGTLLL